MKTQTPQPPQSAQAREGLEDLKGEFRLLLAMVTIGELKQEIRSLRARLRLQRINQPATSRT